MKFPNVRVVPVIFALSLSLPAAALAATPEGATTEATTPTAHHAAVTKRGAKAHAKATKKPKIKAKAKAKRAKTKSRSPKAKSQKKAAPTG